MTKSPILPCESVWLDFVGPIHTATFMEQHPTPEAAVDDYIAGRFYLRDDDRSGDDFYAPYPAWMIDGDVDPPDWLREELLNYLKMFSPSPASCGADSPTPHQCQMQEA